MKFKKATALSAACAVLLLGTAITVFAQNDQREISINDNDIAAVQRERPAQSETISQRKKDQRRKMQKRTQRST